jgi:maleylpyruvate isomerase
MYPSPDHRNSDIEATAKCDPATLRVDVREASARLVAAAEALPDEAWDALLRTARGREISGTEVPWMRAREVWVHAVDLRSGATFDEVPPAMADAFVAEVATSLSERDDCPPVVLLDQDTGRSFAVGPEGKRIDVSGRSSDVLGWLVGRTNGEALTVPSANGAPPAAPRWL